MSTSRPYFHPIRKLTLPIRPQRKPKQEAAMVSRNKEEKKGQGMSVLRSKLSADVIHIRCIYYIYNLQTSNSDSGNMQVPENT